MCILNKSSLSASYTIFTNKVSFVYGGLFIVKEVIYLSSFACLCSRVICKAEKRRSTFAHPPNMKITANHRGDPKDHQTQSIDIGTHIQHQLDSEILLSAHLEINIDHQDGSTGLIDPLEILLDRLEETINQIKALRDRVVYQIETMVDSLEIHMENI